jgi:subtilisin family serine protease
MYNIGQTVCQAGTPGAHINAPAAWDIETDASDIIVAVIDSGVDYTHEDLVNNMWVNAGEQEGDGNNDGRPGVKDVDDDGDALIDEDSEGREPGDPGYTNDLINDDDENGYNDDIYGIDLWDHDSNPMDEYLHGTSIAGTIGAEGNNGVGVTGVCWSVNIMALRLFNNNTHDGTEDHAIDCIKYAVTMGARVINASWGRYDPEGWGRPPYGGPLRDAIEEAGKHGVLLIAAAENHGKDIDNEDPFYPASYDLDNIIGVMATDEHDERSVWDSPYSSNYGALSVDLAAPGTCIWSCTLPYETEQGEVRYDKGEGTSVATPHVTGACALIWAINPTLSHLEVKGIILSTVDELESLKNDPQYGRLCLTGGRLNVGSAAQVAGDYAPVFSVKDNNGDRVMWFDDFGNLFVKGRLSTGQPGQNEGIEGHWAFDEGSGQTAYDSGGSNHGTLGNSTGQDAHDPTWVTGKIVGALNFAGDDYVSLTNPIEALKGSNVTVAAWIKPANVGGSYDPIVRQYSFSSPNYSGYDLCLNSAGKPGFFLDNTGALAGNPLISGNWYHLAGTYDSQELRIYVDGVSKARADYPSESGTPTDAFIGYGLESTGNAYFDGIIDDVRVYNYAMRCSEVRDLLFPNSSRFRVCNSSDETVSWFDDCGYGWFKGAIHERQSSLDPESNETDDFVVKNSDNDVVAFISDSGDLYLKGSLYEYEE